MQPRSKQFTPPPSPQLSRAEQAKLAVMLESNPQVFQEQLAMMRIKQPQGKIKIFSQWTVLRNVNLEKYTPADLKRIDLTNIIFVAVKLPNAAMRDTLLANGATFRGPYFVSGQQQELCTLQGMDSYHWGIAARNPTQFKAKLDQWREKHPNRVLDLAIMFPAHTALSSFVPSDFARIRLIGTALDDAIMTPELELFFQEQGARIFKNQILTNPPIGHNPAEELTGFLKKMSRYHL